MEELESQIAKIELGNSKNATSFVFVMVEKAAIGNSELHVLAELPLTPPMTIADCERICQAIGSTLRRAYKRGSDANTFENAISLINEELGKLACMGQAQWIAKLNCILGAKEGHNFSIATCGKVSAYLIRNQEYTDISCSPGQIHPIKTFENYAVGKIRLNDVLLLANTQLFNNISMDRLLAILQLDSFLKATQTVIELLKQNAGSATSFGVILNRQVPLGYTEEEQIDLENYSVEKGEAENLAQKAINYLKTAFALDKARAPKVGLPKISLNSAANLGNKAKGLAQKSILFWQFTKTSAKTMRQNANWDNFKGLSQAKKFLLVAVIVLLIALVSNIFIAVRVKKINAQRQQITGQLKDAQTLLLKAQSSLLYKDDSGAADYFAQAKNKMPQASQTDSSNKNLYAQVEDQIVKTQAQIDKISQADVKNLGSLSPADFLIKLPNLLATFNNGSVLSYNLQSGKVEDGSLSMAGFQPGAETYINGNLAALYGNGSLALWDFTTGQVGARFNLNVPSKEAFAGMAYYPVNKRIYVLNKTAGEITSYLADKKGLSKPVVSVSAPLAKDAIDIAIDGNIYLLSKSGVSKLTSGRLSATVFAQPSVPFSGTGKIYTQKDFAYVYVLDIGNGRILVYAKNGRLAYTLASKDFSKLKDFMVDEKGKIIYLLNDGSLLKAVLP